MKNLKSLLLTLALTLVLAVPVSLPAALADTDEYALSACSDEVPVAESITYID